MSYLSSRPLFQPQVAERRELVRGEAALGLRAHADGPRPGVELQRRPEVVPGDQKVLTLMSSIQTKTFLQHLIVMNQNLNFLGGRSDADFRNVRPDVVVLRHRGSELRERLRHRT